MDRHDPPRASDKAHQPPPGADHGHGQALQKDAGFSQVGDQSGNHAWAKMTGQPAAGTDNGAQQAAAAAGGKGTHVDFAAHGDIYASPNSKANMASFRDAWGSPARQGFGAGHDAGGKDSPSNRNAYAHSDGSAAGDRISDKPSMANASDGNRPPEIKTPTPEQIKDAPIEQLQSMSRQNRQALDNYVQQQGDKLPTIATHGTDKEHGERLSNGITTSNTEIWAAGQHPDRRELGAHQQVGDLSVAARYSASYAEKRAQHGGGAGPIHVYDISNQPESFSKNKDSERGHSFNGTSDSDVAKFANVDLNKAKLLGSVSRDQLNQMNKQFGEHNGALQEKQRDLLSQPGGITPEQTKDLLDRVQVMHDNRSNHEVRAVLDVVAKSRDNEM